MAFAIENSAGREMKPRNAQGRPKWLVPALIILACLGAIAAGVDARFVEPFRIETTHFDVQARLRAPLKIAQFSDIHTHGMGPNERRALHILAQENPDLIVITGDCLANHAGDYRMCEAFYRQLHAPLGVWVVRGNWENDRPVYHERAFYARCGVHLLVNANASPRPDFELIGFDDYITGVARPNAALAGIPGGVYKIALFHSPAYLDRIAGRVDLCLAGHTHGGQVRVPLLPPLWLPNGSWPYVAGWYEKKGTKMYVNRGLGMSNLPIRFDCRPEIAFLMLHP